MLVKTSVRLPPMSQLRPAMYQHEALFLNVIEQRTEDDSSCSGDE